MYLGHDYYYQRRKREMEEMYEYERKEREREQKMWRDLYKPPSKNPGFLASWDPSVKCPHCGKSYRRGTFHSCYSL